MEYWTHSIDPILLDMGPIQVRWYGLMYLVGYVTGYFFLKHRWKRGLFALNPEEIQMLIFYLMVGMILGARILYVLVYGEWSEYAKNPLEIIAIWHGGLSFHGALIGFCVASYVAAKKLGLTFYHVTDTVVMGSSLGIFWGRLGNFINGELWGRPTDVPWAIIFGDHAGNMPRHPSQLYQAFGEGLFVLIALLLLEKFLQRKGMAPSPIYALKEDDKKKTKPQLMHWPYVGIIGSTFLIFYGIARFIVEFFREPDRQMGFYFKYFSMGQILCTIMILIGATLLYLRLKNPIEENYKVTPQP